MYGKKNQPQTLQLNKYITKVGEKEVPTTGQRKIIWDGRYMTQPRLREK